MSLVGTRPPTVDEWDKYELHHRARLATKPGLGFDVIHGCNPPDDIYLVAKHFKKYGVKEKRNYSWNLLTK